MRHPVRSLTRRIVLTLIAANAAVGLGLVVVDRLWYARPAFPVPHLAAGRVWRPAADPVPGRHALVLSGGIRPGRNHARYWNNVSLVYCALRERGWGDVEVLMADGRSPAPDQLTRSVLGMYGRDAPVDGARDLDGDGTEDVTGPATRDALRQVLERIGRRIHAGDDLFIFMTDHGQLRRSGLTVSAVVLLWGEELAGAEFDRIVRGAVPAGARVTILATQCHSARFLGEVGRPGTVLMASGYPLWIYSDQYYSVFPYLFCEALLGREPVTGQRRGEPATGLAEAFRRARAADHAPEWPQMWTTPETVARPAGR